MARLTKEELTCARYNWHGESHAILFDHIDALESDLTTARAETAAMLEKAAGVICEFCRVANTGEIVAEKDMQWSSEAAYLETDKNWKHVVIDKYGSRNIGLCAAPRIRDLITTDHAAALADVKITATREEYFVWQAGLKGELPPERRVSIALSERDRKVRLEEAEEWKEEHYTESNSSIRWADRRIAELRAPAERGKE